jgi:uncharacterized membrane protein YdjX (TVP38/TMEM64 family)
VGINYGVFFFGTLIGLIPNAIVLAKAGVELSSLGQSSSSGFDIWRLLNFLAIGLLVLLPVVIKQAFKSKVA